MNWSSSLLGHAILAMQAMQAMRKFSCVILRITVCVGVLKSPVYIKINQECNTTTAMLEYGLDNKLLGTLLL